MSRIYHSFDIEMAEKLGINAAIILKFLEDTAPESIHARKGLLWKTNVLREVFPYMTDLQFNLAILRLADLEQIDSGRFIQIRGKADIKH